MCSEDVVRHKNYSVTKDDVNNVARTTITCDVWEHMEENTYILGNKGVVEYLRTICRRRNEASLPRGEACSY